MFVINKFTKKLNLFRKKIDIKLKIERFFY